MKKSEVKKGMKVKFLSEDKHKACPEFYPPVGTIGVVDRFHTDGDVKVQWPKGTTGGDCMWWASAKDLEPAARRHAHENIIIYHDKCDPRLVIAKDLRSGKTGVAKCNPEDVFNFYTGAGIAMGRLAREMGAPVVTDVVGKKAEPKCKFKVGDIIVGNKKANKYVITKQGWIGKVTEVFPVKRDGICCDEGKDIWFEACGVNGINNPTFQLDQDAFDLA